MAYDAYNGAVEKALRALGLDALLQPRAFCSALLDFSAGADNLRDIKMLQLIADEALFGALYAASNVSASELRLARGKVRAKLVDEFLLADAVANRLADALAEGVCQAAFGMSLDGAAVDGRRGGADDEPGAPLSDARAPSTSEAPGPRNAFAPSNPCDGAVSTPNANLAFVVNPLASTALGSDPLIWGSAETDRLSRLSMDRKRQFALQQGPEVFRSAARKLGLPVREGRHAPTMPQCWDEFLALAGEHPLPVGDEDNPEHRQSAWSTRVLRLCMASRIHPDSTAELAPADLRALEEDPIAWWIAQGDAVPDSYIDAAVKTQTAGEAYYAMAQRCRPYHRAICLGSAEALGKMAYEYYRLATKIERRPLIIDKGKIVAERIQQAKTYAELAAEGSSWQRQHVLGRIGYFWFRWKLEELNAETGSQLARRAFGVLADNDELYLDVSPAEKALIAEDIYLLAMQENHKKDSWFRDRAKRHFALAEEMGEIRAIAELGFLYHEDGRLEDARRQFADFKAKARGRSGVGLKDYLERVDNLA